jgi:predicted metal-dependent HD superfamily phosphohydrolase
VTSPEVELRRAWHRLAGRRADDVFDGLLARHREPHRRYHTATHVMWVCRHVDRLAQVHPVADLDAVRAAALFHDAVYDPRSSTNERDSADLADRRLRELDWPTARRAHVRALIEATRHHLPGAPGDGVPVDATGPADTGPAATGPADTAVLLDADLAVLGAPANDYLAYVAGIRAEYGHVGDDAWRDGRAAVLEAFLGRSSIYATSTMRAERERRARANLRAELAALRPPGGAPGR